MRQLRRLRTQEHDYKYFQTSQRSLQSTPEECTQTAEWDKELDSGSKNRIQNKLKWFWIWKTKSNKKPDRKSVNRLIMHRAEDQRNNCTTMFTAAAIITARKLNQSRCPTEYCAAGSGGTRLFPNIQEVEEGGSESEDNLLYRVRSRTTRAKQEKPCLKGGKKRLHSNENVPQTDNGILFSYKTIKCARNRYSWKVY